MRRIYRTAKDEELIVNFDEAKNLGKPHGIVWYKYCGVEYCTDVYKNESIKYFIGPHGERIDLKDYLYHKPSVYGDSAGYITCAELRDSLEMNPDMAMMVYITADKHTTVHTAYGDMVVDFDNFEGVLGKEELVYVPYIVKRIVNEEILLEPVGELKTFLHRIKLSEMEFNYLRNTVNKENRIKIEFISV